jgi:hypothetical protein
LRDACDTLPAVAGSFRNINIGEKGMTLPTNDDFADCELSVEELETIAAGGFWSTLGSIAKFPLALFSLDHPSMIGKAFTGGISALKYLF